MGTDAEYYPFPGGWRPPQGPLPADGGPAPVPVTALAMSSLPPIPSPESGPRPEGTPPNTPSWMDVPEAAPTGRTGATPSRGLGWQTIAFFVIITLAVGAAGFAGIAMWGPEKPIKNRSQLATNPPPPTVLPSLSESDLGDAPPAAAAPSDSAAPNDAPPSTDTPPKKGKKGRGKHR